MGIDHNNIEIYLLDYLEGNLDPVHTAELMAFLAENPEYEELIRDTGRYKLAPTGDQFPDRNALKRNYRDIPEINPANFDEFCIASVEGLLDEPGTKQLNNYIGEDSRKRKNLELFYSLKLKPDHTIQYPYKAKLKKTGGLQLPRKYLIYGLAIAASLALLLILTLNKSESGLSEPPSNVISDKTTTVPVVDEPELIDNNAVEPSNTERSHIAGNSSSQSKSGYIDNDKSEENISIAEIIPDPLPGRREEMNLAGLEPLQARVNQKENYANLRFGNLNNQSKVKPAHSEQQLHIESENLFADILQKINFWKTAETAINGFNYLTEAKISIDKVTDEDGKLSRLTLNTESYSIEGKLR